LIQRTPWNHNLQYHPLILRSLPPECGRVLDVGCGRGTFTRKLVSRSREVFGIDADAATLAHAISSGGGPAYLAGDFLTYPFASESFDLITIVAALHHLPLRPALVRVVTLLKPGGTLVVLGLYRLHSPLDFAFAALGKPISWVRRLGRPPLDDGAPVLPPAPSLADIRKAAEELLPGALLRRRLFFRYSLIWRKP
jgi:SAM-dependent methyltransferase